MTDTVHTPEPRNTPEPLNVEHVRIDPAWALRIPAALALRRLVLPFACCNDVVHVACSDPHDVAALEAVERFCGKTVEAEEAEPESLRRIIQRIYGGMQTGGDGRSVLRTDVRTNEVEGADSTTLCDELLYAAVVREASDIHVEPAADHLHVRMRVDGVLETYRTLPLAVLLGVISRFKVLAGMDIAEKRAPQDGGFSHRAGGRKIDVRVATLPTKHGERMTLRLLALQTESLTVERLGMAPEDLEAFENRVDMPHGMILLTGPTGSGKTTTLYAALRRIIARGSDNILTIEDPIEYSIPGVSQVEVDTADKVNFSRALRSVLRHDPDVVMIGEIRDYETADVAIKASLTGHLVFSTLHTNSAAGVVTRLADMKVERFLIAATLRLAASQRLVRKLCAKCRVPRELTTLEAAALGKLELAGRTVFDPHGCKYCAGRGLAGRMGLFELLATDEEMARQIAAGITEEALTAAARERGGKSLVDDACDKLFSGATSVREVMSAVTVW